MARCPVAKIGRATEGLRRRAVAVVRAVSKPLRACAVAVIGRITPALRCGAVVPIGSVSVSLGRKAVIADRLIANELTVLGISSPGHSHCDDDHYEKAHFDLRWLVGCALGRYIVIEPFGADRSLDRLAQIHHIIDGQNHPNGIDLLSLFGKSSRQTLVKQQQTFVPLLFCHAVFGRRKRNDAHGITDGGSSLCATPCRAARDTDLAIGRLVA